MFLEFTFLGSKIMESSNFVKGALDEFPKTFGLIEFKKRYFPYFLIVKVNDNYIGPIQAPYYHCVYTMKQKTRELFLKRYEEKKEKVKK